MGHQQIKKYVRSENKWAKLKQNSDFTDVGMGIHCEAPTPTLFYFSFGPPLPMFLTNFFFCIQKTVFFIWNGEDRYSPSCPFSSFPTLFFPNQGSRNEAELQHLCPDNTKLADPNQVHTDGCHSLTWNPGLDCKMPAKRCSFNSGTVLATPKRASSHLS